LYSLLPSPQELLDEHMQTWPVWLIHAPADASGSTIRSALSEIRLMKFRIVFPPELDEMN
jgi:hypothetical protein